ncbi:hypothetical protein [Embleya sp. NPDC059259]|uniref:hypothetical protein n=1 Tax=unclassified Embleya TaxID=2699296 RepID=UPI0036AA23E1
MVELSEAWIASVERCWRDTLDLLLAWPERDACFWLRRFPRGSCDISSYVIANVLHDRGLGTWWLFTGSFDDPHAGQFGHTWCEYRPGGQSSPAMYFIDASLGQFPDLGRQPTAGPGTSPARQRFARRRHDEQIGRLPDHWAKSDDVRALAHVRSASA